MPIDSLAADVNRTNPQRKKIKRSLMRSTEAAFESHTHANKPLLDSITQEDFDLIQTLNTQVNQLQQTVISLQNQINSNDTELADHETRITSLQSQVNSNDTELANHETRITALENP